MIQQIWREFELSARRPWRRSFWLTVLVGFSFFTLLSGARSVIGGVSVVSGSSMSPTFLPGTWLLTRPISGQVSRGDIVLLDDGNFEMAVKRVVGLPGERVQLRHGYVFINGRILIEPYLPLRVYTFGGRSTRDLVLGSDEYFVMGDNRPVSADSRSYGPVHRKQIRQRVSLPPDSPRAHPGPVSLAAS